MIGSIKEETVMKPEQSVQNKAHLAAYRTALSRYIRSTMVLKGLKYEDLSSELAQFEVYLTQENLRSKVSKGMFSADLLLLLFKILNVEQTACGDILTLVDQG
jgi:hypothetical protein